MDEINRQAVIYHRHRGKGVGEITDAAQHPLHAGDQFAGAERLGDVVLGEVLYALDNRLFLIYAVSMMTGRSLNCWTVRQKSKPSMPGIRMSTMAKWGRPCWVIMSSAS